MADVNAIEGREGETALHMAVPCATDRCLDAVQHGGSPMPWRLVQLADAVAARAALRCRGGMAVWMLS